MSLGQPADPRFAALSALVFARFPCPVLRLVSGRKPSWHVAGIQPVALNALAAADRDRLLTVLRQRPEPQPGAGPDHAFVAGPPLLATAGYEIPELADEVDTGELLPKDAALSPAV